MLFVLALSACAPALDGDVRMVHGGGTLVRVVWNTTIAAHSRLRWGTDPERVVDGGEGVEHAAMLVGLLPQATEPVTLEVLDGDQVVDTVTTEVVADPAPPQFPVFSRAGGDEDPGWFVASLFGSPQGAAIFSTDGSPLWWSFNEEKGVAITDAQLDLAHQKVRYLEFTPNPLSPDDSEAGIGRILEEDPFDGTTTEIAIAEGHHSFAQLPDGALAWLVSDFREVDGAWVRGDKLVERDAEGNERELWSAWDSFSYDPTIDDDGTGWTHANCVTWDEATQTYLVSTRNESAIVAVGRDGQVRWTFGGPTPSFTVLESRSVLHQHRPRLYDDGATLLIFDNGESVSQVAEYALDADAGIAVERSRLDLGLLAYSLGDVQRLANDDLVVTWGTAGALSAVAPDGTERWTLSGDLGAAFGFGQFLQPGDVLLGSEL